MTGEVLTMAAPVPISPGQGQRAAVRTRRALRTGLANVFANGVGVAARLVSIPLSLKLLGAERYGVWLAAGSLTGWGGLFDLGMCAGLVNAISQGSASEDDQALKRHMSTAVYGLAILAGGLLLAFLAVSQWSGLGRLLGTAGDTQLLSDARALWLLAGISFAGSFAFSWVPSLCLGRQEGHLSSMAPIAGSLVSVSGLAILVQRGGGVIEFGLVMGAPPVLATGVLAVILLRGRYRRFRPRWGRWSLDSFRQIMRVGAPLFLLQLSDVAILNSANVLIANRLGPSEVPRYAVAYALFSVASKVCYLLAVPHWPGYTEAAEKGDWAWVRATARRWLAVTGLLMGLTALCILASGEALIRWWAGQAAVPPASLLPWMAVYFVLAVCSTTNGILLNGLGRVGVRTYLRLPVGLAHIAGGWSLLPVLGLMAIPLAGGIGFLADCVVLLPYAFREIRKCASSRAGARSGAREHGGVALPLG